MPRKKVLKTKIVKIPKKQDVIVKRPKKPRLNPELNDKNLRIRDWLLSKKKEKIKYPKLDITLDEDLENDNYNDDEKNEVNYDENLKNLKPRNKKILTVVFGCEWEKCNGEFEEYELYVEHITEHLLDLTDINEDDQFICLWDLCNFQTPNKDTLTRHVYYHAYHTQLKTFGDDIRNRLTIPRCNNDSRQRNIIPEMNYDFACQWASCTATFNAIQRFFEHAKNHCKWESDFSNISVSDLKDDVKCRWVGCEKKCKNLFRLVEHVRSHTHEKLVACDHCGTTFFNNTKFLDHCKRQVINSMLEYSCGHCYKSFSSARLLREHVRMHVNCFKCTMCDMTCPSRSTLATHIRFKHIEERPFKCTLCSFNAVRKRDFQFHLMTHNKDKEYECPEFGCNFITKSFQNLKKHDGRVHSGGPNPKIYACHCCDNKYKRGDYLSQHLKKVHGFQLPSGNSRFIYREDDDEYYRVQTMRIESLEVSKQIMSTAHEENVERKNMVDMTEDISMKEKIDKPVARNNVIAPLPIIVDDESNDVIKNIDDFTVMKKYLKRGKRKNIVITVADTDVDGNIIQTKTIDAEEICIT